MSWTAEITDKSKDPSNGNIVVTALFANSDTRETQTRRHFANDLTDDGIAMWAKKVIVSLEERDAAFDQVTVGKVTPMDVPVTEAQTFQANVNRLAILKQLVDIGVEEAKVDHAAMLATVRAAYKGSLVGL